MQNIYVTRPTTETYWKNGVFDNKRHAKIGAVHHKKIFTRVCRSKPGLTTKILHEHCLQLLQRQNPRETMFYYLFLEIKAEYIFIQ